MGVPEDTMHATRISPKVSLKSHLNGVATNPLSREPCDCPITTVGPMHVIGERGIVILPYLKKEHK